MLIFRALLVVLWVVLMAYTGVVISNHGMGLLPIFFGDMAAMTWPGQFNLDFMFMLILSALWVAWRHQFSGLGLALGLLALIGGASFLTVYLLVLSLRSNGNVKVILLGMRT
ncbi:MAG: hypothetical protein ACKVOO_00990 [Burkholderiaceae bacterium]